MAFLNKLLEDIKIATRLKTTAIVLSKLDVEKIADYLVDYGERFYKRGKKDFIELVYVQLLCLTSAINRRRIR